MLGDGENFKSLVLPLEIAKYPEIFAPAAQFAFRNTENPNFSRACGAKMTVLPLENQLLMYFRRAAGGNFWCLFSCFPFRNHRFELQNSRFFRPPEAAKILRSESELRKQGRGAGSTKSTRSTVDHVIDIGSNQLRVRQQ